MVLRASQGHLPEMPAEADRSRRVGNSFPLWDGTVPILERWTARAGVGTWVRRSESVQPRVRRIRSVPTLYDAWAGSARVAREESRRLGTGFDTRPTDARTGEAFWGHLLSDSHGALWAPREHPPSERRRPSQRPRPSWLRFIPARAPPRTPTPPTPETTPGRGQSAGWSARSAWLSGPRVDRT